jgi:phosphatidylinositol glycan class N
MMMSLVVVEILVAAFFERRLFTIALLIVMMWQLYSHSKKSPMTLRILWVFLCLTLCLFTFQPSIHKQKSNFLVLSASLLSCGVSLFLHNKKTNAVNVGQHWSMTILAPFVITSGVCVWITDSGSDLAKEFSQYVAWMILITAIPISLLSPRALIPRLISLSMALLSIYILLCISYEALFLLCLMGTMFTWLTMNALENQDQNKTKTSTRADPKDVMTALMFLLFSLTSFFGTGNVASINSFDPKSIQTLVCCF